MMFENVIRTSLVLFTVLISLKVPYFGEVLGTIGGFTDAIVSFVLPPLIFLKLNENNAEVSNLQRYFNVGVLLFGMTLVVKTTYTIIASCGVFSHGF
jgi:amino acid permease